MVKGGATKADNSAVNHEAMYKKHQSLTIHRLIRHRHLHNRAQLLQVAPLNRPHQLPNTKNHKDKKIIYGKAPGIYGGLFLAKKGTDTLAPYVKPSLSKESLNKPILTIKQQLYANVKVYAALGTVDVQIRLKNYNFL